MTDFCYMANGVVMLFFVFYPKSETLFFISFCFANGCLATAVGAFRNQMVFHKIDNLTSLALHMIPQATMWNLKWITMDYEKSLKPEDRNWLTLSDEIPLSRFFVGPLTVYFVWFVIYYMINFRIALERIRTRNYDNMLILYERQEWSRKMLHFLGKEKVGIMFFIIHFNFFFWCHMFSIACYYSYYFHTFAIIFWLSWSVWNGASFYMDYFAKKYEASLQKLKDVEKDLKDESNENKKTK